MVDKSKLKDTLKIAFWIVVLSGVFILSVDALYSLGAIVGALIIIAVLYGILEWKSLKKIIAVAIIIFVISIFVNSYIATLSFYQPPVSINSNMFVNSSVSPFHAPSGVFNFTTYVNETNTNYTYSVYINITNTAKSFSFGHIMYKVSNVSFVSYGTIYKKYYFIATNLSGAPAIFFYTFSVEENFTNSTTKNITHKWVDDVDSSGNVVMNEGPFLVQSMLSLYPYIFLSIMIVTFLYAGVVTALILGMIFLFRERRTLIKKKRETEKKIEKLGDYKEGTKAKNINLTCSNCGAIVGENDKECWKCHSKFEDEPSKDSESKVDNKEDKDKGNKN
ncbi:MAG: LapA family protein [Thermoplasmata archaeon]